MQGISDFRHICLVGCLQRIISKILASRIKGDLGALISLCQTTFVPARHLLGDVLAANEVLDLVTRTMKSCMLLNIDFEKAYDKVSWN